MKLPRTFFTELEQIIQKIHMCCQSNTKKKEQSRRHKTTILKPIIQSYTKKATIIKTIIFVKKKKTTTTDRHRYWAQWNRTGSLEINPHTYGQIVFNKRSKNIKWEKNFSK